MTGPNAASRTGVAFFDVDETLLSIKSMVSFYRYHCRQLPPDEERTRIGDLDALLESGRPRERANTDFYRFLEGMSADAVADSGNRWFTDVARPAVNAAVSSRLTAHRRRGHTVVLVSGSFPACLDPIATYVAADVVLCSRPTIVAGTYTGSLPSAMIGAGKAAAVTDILELLPPGPSWAYGDHESDLPMLELVDTPVVVGNDTALSNIAAERGWEILAEEPTESGGFGVPSLTHVLP